MLESALPLFLVVIPYFFGVIYHGVTMKGLGLLGLALASRVWWPCEATEANQDLKAKSVFDAYFKEE